VTAVVAYGVANLDTPLTREGVYLADGLYATITVGRGDAQKQILASLDYANAPVQVANFVRIVEGNTPAAAGGRGAGGGGGRGGPGGPGGPPEAPPIGATDVVKGLIQSVIASPTQKAMAVASLPKATNAALSHDAAGVVGVSGPNAFYITLEKNAALDKKYTAIGRVIAGAGSLSDIRTADPIGSIRFTRVGQAARDFKTDDETFKKLVDAATTKKK
jgi:cyclophilin family peptidyl-prolyl cis-trans isomerase